MWIVTLLQILMCVASLFTDHLQLISKTLPRQLTDQPEDPAVGTKRARMMSGSKIVLPSSDVYEYSQIALRSKISQIANPKGMILFN